MVASNISPAVKCKGGKVLHLAPGLEFLCPAPSVLCFAGLYIREDGVVFDAALVDEVGKVVTKILQDCEQYANGYWVDDAIPKSVGQHLRRKFERYLHGCAEDSEETRYMKEELFDWHLRYLLPCVTVL
jgi:hypothetical protein